MTDPAPPPPPEESDAALLARYVRGRDGAAFAELVRRFGPLVWGVCVRRLGTASGGRHDAEDAFQAAFLTLALKADTVRDPAALPGWLHRVAHRCATRAARRASNEPDAELPDAAADDPGVLAELARREEAAAFDDELLKLPAAERAAVTLCHLHGLTREAAAVRLRTTPAAVKGRLSRGRARLRGRLAKRGFGLPLAAVSLLSPAPPAAAAEAVRRLADPLALFPPPGVSPLSLSPFHGRTPMQFLTDAAKTRTGAACLTAAACLGLFWLLQPPAPLTAGDGGAGSNHGGFAAPTPLDGRLAAVPVPAATPSPAFRVRPAAYEQEPAGGDAGGETDGKPGGPGVRAEFWARPTPYGLARLELAGGRLALDAELNIDGETFSVGVTGEYAELSDGMLAGVIHSVDLDFGAAAAELAAAPDVAFEYAALSQAMTDRAFSLRVYRPEAGGELIVKSVSLAGPTLSDIAALGDTNADLADVFAMIPVYTDFILPGRWSPAGPDSDRPGEWRRDRPGRR